MTTIPEPHLRCKGQTVSDEYRRGVFSHTPALGRLLDNLDAGKTPNFLEVICGFVEKFAFYTEYEPIYDELYAPAP